jgi:hypothetical protein
MEAMFSETSGFSRLHGVTTQKTVLSTDTVVRTPNPTKYTLFKDMTP